MNSQDPVTQSLSAEDRVILGKLKEKAWFSLLRLYVPLLLFLVLVYFKMQPGGTFRGHTLKYSREEFRAAYIGLVVVFGGVFIGFMVRDFRRLVLPFQREARAGQKYCVGFAARKYLDILYGKHLLFYPGKDNIYIEVSKEDFESIVDGEGLYLETACVTGEVLALKCGDRVFKDPEEFSFSDR